MDDKPEEDQNGIASAPKGYYSKRFRDAEARELKNISPGLVDEITLMRVLIRRVFEVAHREDDNLETWSHSLETLSIAAWRMAALIRTHKDLSGEKGTQLEASLSKALREATRELGLDEKFKHLDEYKGS